MPTIVYDLAAKFSLESVGVAAGVAGLVRAFSDLERQATVAELAVKRLNDQQAMSGMTAAQRQAYQMTAALDAQTAAQEKLTLATAAFQKMLVGGLMVTGGLAIFGELKKATDLASQYVQTMTQVQIATNATPTQMAALQKLAVQQGTRTQFSMNEEAAMQAALTKTRIDTVGALTAMMPAVNNFAETLLMARNVPATQSAQIAGEFAHLFGQYTALGGPNGPGMQYMTNLLGRALAVTPASPQEFLNLTSQFAGTMRPLYGQSAADQQRFISDAIATSVLEAQLGQQTRGGTQIARLVTRTLGGATSSTLTGGTAQDKALRALTDMTGLSFFDKQGKFAGMSNLTAIMELAATKKGETPQSLGKLFQNAFGLVGNRQAGILAEKTTFDQLKQIGQMLDPKTGLISLNKMRQMYNQTPQGQANRAASNIQTFETEMGLTFIPVMTTALGAVANLTAALANLAADHPLLTKLAAGAVALGAGFLTVAGAVKLFQGAWEILKITTMLGQIQKLAVAMKGMMGLNALSGAAGTIRLVAGAYLAAAGAALRFVAAQVAAGASSIASWATGDAGALRVLAAGYLTTTLAVARLTLAQIATGAAAAASAAGQIAVGVASRAMAVGEGIATVASAALDLALSPIVLTVGAVVAGIGAFVLIATHWRTALDVLTGKFGPFAQGLAMAFGPLFAVPATIGAIIANLPKLYQMLQRAPQAAANAGAGILSDIEHIVLPGLPQGISFSPFGTGTGGGGAGTGSGGGGLPALALAGAAGGGTAHKHYHLHVAPGAITVNSQPHHNEDALAAKVMDALSRQWGHGGQWGNTDPVGLQVGPFGY